MRIALAILTVSCICWIITREVLFQGVRTWAGKQGKWAYPLTCAYCLIPWVTGAIWIGYALPLMWLFPAIWLSYWNIAVFAYLRKKVL